MSVLDVTIACCQLAPEIGAQDANRARAAEAVTGAVAAGAQIVVLPELAVSGYVFADADEARRLAEPADGPTTRQWADLARRLGVVVVGGFCELGADGTLHNSAAIVDRDGVRAVYRKTHLWDREREVFAPGASAPPVVGTAYGRVAAMVCYDVEFPEWVRLPALAGADLLCVPANWPASPRPAGERPAEVVRVQAAAAVNRVFVAACDRVGVERGVDWVGGSVIADVDGFAVAGPAAPGAVETLLASVPLARARDKRLNDRNDVLADRRPELYAEVARPQEPVPA